jgi:hypothetical protein
MGVVQSALKAIAEFLQTKIINPIWTKVIHLFNSIVDEVNRVITSLQAKFKKTTIDRNDARSCTAPLIINAQEREPQTCCQTEQDEFQQQLGKGMQEVAEQFKRAGEQMLKVSSAKECESILANLSKCTVAIRV